MYVIRPILLCQKTKEQLEYWQTLNDTVENSVEKEEAKEEQQQDDEE